ncbi:MBL fold metallo-hydrolase [Intestinibacter sp.]
MIIEKVVDRFMGENTYILGDEKTKKCAVIDPGASIIDIFNIIKQHGLTVEYIILTHGHGDHICRVPEIKSQTDALVVAHVKEDEVLNDRVKNLSGQLPGPLVELEADRYVEEGDIIKLGDLKLKIIHTPGHTKGGMCIKVDENIFTGDTLFAGGIGRTDFYGGDYKQIMKSLKKLAKYDDNAVIYPGHGPESTIGVEKRMNPYMQQI